MNIINKKWLWVAFVSLPMLCNAQEVVTFTNDCFKNLMLNNSAINLNGDDEIQLTEASLYTGFLDLRPCLLNDTNGLEAFTAITSLNISESNLTTLDLNSNTLLEELDCSGNNLENINLTQNTSLENLICSNNDLESINLTQNTSLETLICTNNNLESIDLTLNTSLKNLNINGNNLNSIDLANNSLLENLECADNQLENLDVSQNGNLNKIQCGGNLLSNIDLNNNLLLEYLNVGWNPLDSTIDFSANTNLLHLTVSGTTMTSLDTSPNSNLEYLACVNMSDLETVDVSNNINLVNLSASYNPNMRFINVANGHNENLWVHSLSNPSLICIQTDEGTDPEALNWFFDDNISFSTDCSELLSTQEQDSLLDYVKLYPNPVTDILHIKSTYPVKEVRVYDAQAKRIKQFSNKNQVNLHDLIKGVYIIQVETSKSVYSEKVVKK